MINTDQQLIIRSSNMGKFIAATPGNVGIVHMKCEIYANKPITKRPKQDIRLIVSPETITSISEEISQKLWKVNGMDGIFLKPKHNIESNFIGLLKKEKERKNSTLQDFKQNIIEERKSKSGGKGDEGGLPDYKGVKMSEIDIIPPLGIDVKNSLNKELLDFDDPSLPHYTWILDGSLWTTNNLSFDEHVLGFDILEVSNDKAKNDARQFLPRFNYIGQSVTIKSVDPRKNGRSNIKVFPSQARTNGVKSPADVESIHKEDNIYFNINPGIHWRVQKLTPVFQGADFIITFKRLADSNDIPDHRNSFFIMRPEFAPLDVQSRDNPGPSIDLGKFLLSIDLTFGSNSLPTNKERFFQNQGVLNINTKSIIDEKSKSIFDLTRQAYYMIEIGVRNDNHNYFILIAENGFPTLLHVSQSPILISSEGNDTNKTLKKEAFLPPVPTSRRLSIYKEISSKELISQDELTVEVRNHFGSLVITFSGHENNPWVISRRDIEITDEELSKQESFSSIKKTSSISNILSTSDFSVIPVPMIVPKAPLAVYAGNVKASFSFNYLEYESFADFTFPQKINVKGPLDKNDISVFLRDMGYSYNPEIADKNYSSSSFVDSVNSSKNKGAFPTNGINYSQDAQRFDEYINGERIVTLSHVVQEKKDKKFGKAPDIYNKDKIGEFPITYSTISAIPNDDLSEIGSSGEFAKHFTLDVFMSAGDYAFDKIDGKQFRMNDIITPIMTGFRVHVGSKGKAYNASKVEVSHHVRNFTEHWNARDFWGIDHSGSIEFLVNDNMIFKDNNNQTDFLLNLVDKTFFLQISVWWEGGVMPLPDSDRDKVLITGFCKGASVSVSNNVKIMKCEIQDYMQIFRDQIFLNSPFFDKMRDFNALYEILLLSGFRDDDNLQPASLMKRLAFHDGEGGWNSIVHNGEVVEFNDYALPGSYDIIQNPFLRFDDGSQMFNAVDKIARLSGKMAYFDRLGVFHLDNLPDERSFFIADNLDVNTKIQDPIDLSIIDVFASPLDRDSGVINDISSTTSSDFINNSDNTKSNNPDPNISSQPKSLPVSNCPAELHRQVFNIYTYKRNMNDVVNEIKVISTTPDGELLIAGHVNYSSLFDHNSPGFIGYSKVFLQMDGIFGSADAVKKVVKHYTKMFVPPVNVSFEMMGHNKLKALDIITFQFLGRSDKQPLRINSLTSTVDPSKNSWIQKFECEWIFPSQSVPWGPSSNEGIN